MIGFIGVTIIIILLFYTRFEMEDEGYFTRSEMGYFGDEYFVADELNDHDLCHGYPPLDLCGACNDKDEEREIFVEVEVESVEPGDSLGHNVPGEEPEGKKRRKVKMCSIRIEEPKMLDQESLVKEYNSMRWRKGNACLLGIYIF